MENTIITNNITKQYKKFKALDSVSIQVEAGTVYGVIGKNGAGKTTLLKIISGLIKATSGDINIQYDKINSIGTLIEEPGLCYDMTGFENLKLKSLAFGLSDDVQLHNILNLVGLSGSKRVKVKNFSLGMKQRLGIGLALVGNPQILILDEPINGLDPQGIVEVRKLILKLKNEFNKTIMVSSHILDELFKIGDKYAIINNGKIVLEATKEELQKRMERCIEVETDQVEDVIELLNQLKLNDYDIHTNQVVIRDKTLEVRALNKMLAEKCIPIDGIKYGEVSYENLFLELIGEKYA
ncbi:ABC-2 type transport system ATP-binding protein [Lachnotalea glycerini]|uniref:ABC-2 type transport system ATP-binding protein n=1 Tax=Lachnotalea glycerini TaxID=1763509 RepID=A0A255IKM6_9FIRM|nr:ATP-binding cassette domain-containing protein [Lachnotalea glycerini]PXV86008.1 ABC-2 type transport system ATP-binding protein [Lachnotalea glycerini]RDY30729.1 ATP-binding cassette domain-containing protein [Lachnotalea glycerini]